MAEEILNKIAQAQIEQIDLARFKTQDELFGIDLKDQLWNELVLKEKEFRLWVKEKDWSVYADKVIYVYCSNDAIIPAWAFMLVTAELQNAAAVYCGDRDFAEEELFF